MTARLVGAGLVLALLGAGEALVREKVFQPRNPSDGHVSPSAVAAPDSVRERTLMPFVGGSSYNPTSPHWSHIRTMVTDFRTGYISNLAQRRSEIEWAAAHFDYVLNGDANSYKALNPGIRMLKYALDWNVMQPAGNASANLATAYYGDMQRWFAGHTQYKLESAFLHVAGGPPTMASRLQFVAWGSRRWAINPGDAGARAYNEDRTRRFVQDVDGVFFDTHGSGSIWQSLGQTKILEYPDRSGYQRDLIAMVGDIAASIAPKITMLNSSNYMKPADYSMTTAAGAAHLERMNNPLSAGMPERWRWIDTLLARNVLVELVTLDSWKDATNAHGPFATFTPGDYASKPERLKMWELASYYMVVPPTPDRLLLDLQNAWYAPFSSVWLKAQEYDVGHPHAPRYVFYKGRDAAGNNYQIWARDFDHALVLVRPTAYWKDQRYDDSTAVTVSLPNGLAMRLLHGDGTLGSPVTSVTLRNAEAAILIK